MKTSFILSWHAEDIRLISENLEKKEVDFVAGKTGGIEYYQVSASVLDSSTLLRELEPLQKIPDHHPKYLLTLYDIIPNTNYDGIRQVNLHEWLLRK